MRAGPLRHPIVIEASERSQDPVTGEITKTWEPIQVAPIWARWEWLSVRDFMAAQAGQSQIVARVTVRYRPGLDYTMRILYRDKIYNIEGLLPDAESGLEYITIPVSEDLPS